MNIINLPMLEIVNWNPRLNLKKEIKSTVKSIAAAFLLLCLFGCAADSVNTVEDTYKTMNPEFVPNKRVVTDNYLADSLKVVDVSSQTSKDGLLKVQVRMKSFKTGLFSSDNQFNIVYRFTWFDKDGIELSIPEEDRWNKKSILPGDDVWINSTAPTKQCKDFVLRLKAVN